ncbi:MAG: FlgD immunoglobulin-like domain containing protein [Bacteroidota bacterium]|nr:FlgD immunoglobulin-like domain containing protein [Bacteroidota bacterium]
MFRHFKNLIFIFIIGAILASRVGAEVLSNSQLNNPYKLTVSNGYLYSVDTANNQIKKFDASGNLVYAYGSFGSGNGQFNQPQGIAVDSNGHIYVVDTGNQRIQKFVDNGDSAAFVQIISDIPELSDPTFSYPRSIRADDNGDIFIVDSAKNRVIKYSSGAVIGGNSGGISAQSVGGAGEVFNAPYGAEIDANGYIYIADTENHKIKKYSAGGKLLLEFGNEGQGNGKFLYPFDVAVDPNGNIYVADTGNHRIQKFDRYGKYITSYGSLGTSDGRFFAPRGVSVSKNGYLYVVGADNRIQKLDVSLRMLDFGVSNTDFSPNGDGVKDEVVFTFKLSEGFIPKVLHLNIYDKSNRILIAQRNRKAIVKGYSIFTWDGKDNAGNLVPDGEYLYKFSGISFHEEKSLISESGDLLVDTTPPEVKGVASSYKISPNGDGKFDAIEVFYVISETCSLEIKVVNPYKVVLSYQDYFLNDLSKEYIFSWDGKDPIQNKFVGDGEYELVYSLKDAAGNSTRLTSKIICDVTPPMWFSIDEPSYNEYLVSGDISLKWKQAIDENLDHYIAKIVKDSSEEAFELASKPIGLGDPLWDPDEILKGGLYHVYVEACDGFGNTRTSYTKFRVDDEPPQITNTRKSTKGFSPNLSSFRFDCLITDNTVTELKNYSVAILDEAGHEIKSMMNEDVSAGTFSFEWDGKDKMGQIADDGIYQFNIEVEDQAQNKTNYTDSFYLDSAPPQVLALNVDPSPFTPNGDGVMDSTTFSFEVSEPSYVTINILKEDGGLYKTHSQILDSSSEEVSITGNWEWGGRGNYGELMGGNYSYYLEVKDFVGNQNSSETGIVAINYEPSLLAYAYAIPDPFAPSNPLNGFTEIKYYLTGDNLDVSVYIMGNEENVIKTLLSTENKDKGEHSVKWYGDYDDGYTGTKSSKDNSKVTDGTYAFRVVIEDPEGGLPADMTNTVLVDNHPPTVYVQSVEVDYASSKADLKYSLTEKASVVVSVFDSTYALLENLVNAEIKDAGEYIVSWQPISNSETENYFKIVAVDEALNRDEKISDNFVLAPTTDFQIVNASVSPSPFTPNGDGYADLARISYSISGGAPDYTVNINIETETGSTVKTLIENDPQSTGNYSFYWDGIGDNGQLVADGNYEYAVSVEDQIGEKVEAQGTMLVVSTRPSVNLSISPSIFSPNGDGSKDTATFNYSINYPIAYITGEALVKLEVLNAASEAVWSRMFNQTAGSYAYEYNGLNKTGISLEAGNYYVRARAEDALGSTAVPKTAGLTVDYTNPEPSDFNIDPLYARSGAIVTISLGFDEELAATPEVTVLKSDLSNGYAILGSVSGNSYVYRYAVSASDAEGIATVSVEAEDLALNPISKTKTFVIDKTNPSVSNFAVAPDPASLPEVSGQVSITFNVSETLEAVPRVYVTQNGASPQLALTNGSWSTVNGLCEGKYDVLSGYDGLAQVTVEVIDLAGNMELSTATFEVDIVLPVFSAIHCEAPNFMDGEYYAKDGDEVDIYFTTSEQLQFNPEVKVNGDRASYHALIGDEYHYKYTIDAGKVSELDNKQLARMSVSGYDIAGNEGNTETSQSSESFTIDIELPDVAISSDPVLIANPGTFTPNNDGVNDTTTLQYTISEYSRVSLKIYKFNELKVYDASNLVQELIDSEWKGAGAHSVMWDGTLLESKKTQYDTNNNGFVDSGKYAFVVELRDIAGNISARKGGTVYVQDIILHLTEPENRSEANNPEPKIICPDGNSVVPGQKQAEFFYKINTEAQPPSSTIPEPEPILQIFSLNPVGKITIEVFDSGANLVKVLKNNEDVLAGSNLSVIWDGTDGSNFVVDGLYSIKASLSDFTGVMSTPLVRSVTVDNTLPVAVVSSPLGNSVNKDVITIIGTAEDTNFDSYELYYGLGASPVSWTKIGDTVYSPVNGNVLGSWNTDALNNNYTIKLVVRDKAGNFETNTVLVNVDNTEPRAALNAYTSPKRATVAIGGASDDNNYQAANFHEYKLYYASGFSAEADWNEIGTYTSPVTDGILGNWETSSLDGNFTLRVVTTDKAFKQMEAKTNIVIDNQPPTGSITINSGNVYTSSNIVSLYLPASDNLEVISVDISNDGSDWTSYSYSGENYTWTITPDTPGQKTVYVKFYDEAGNSSETYTDQIFLYSLKKLTSYSGPDWDAAFYSNSDKLAYVSDNGGYKNIWTINIDGTGNSKLTHNNDNSSVKFEWLSGLSGGSDIICWDEGYQMPDPWDFFLTVGINSSGNVFGEFDGYSGMEMHYSLASGWIATYNSHVEAGGGGWTGIEVQPSDGSQPIEEIFTSTQIGSYFTDFAWSPDGSKLAVGTETNGLWIVNRNGSGRTQIVNGNAEDPSFSSGGSQIVFVSNGNINKVNVNGLGLITLLDDSSTNSHPKWSPADKIIYVANNGSSEDLWIMSTNGGNRFKLTSGIPIYSAMVRNTYPYSPSPAKWSPDGNKYAFVSGSNTVPENIYVINFGNLSAISALSIISVKKPVVAQNTSLESPILIAPEDINDPNYKDVQSLRPTFEWQHRKRETQEYKIDLAKNDSFAIDHQTFTKSPNSGSQADPTNDPGLYNYTYSIHEFDPGLDRDTYYWKVTATSTSESATSEVRSFTVAPQLTLTGVTNFPNPFNPNRETTQIRYRLGADVDAVKIRIYDVVGSLVKEITNCPTDGEGSSVWSKYNDVDWDGCNGRGDLVRNGIYPFEIVARLGDKSVSARGKVAVLK